MSASCGSAGLDLVLALLTNHERRGNGCRPARAPGAVTAEDGGELNVAFMGDRTIATEEIYALCKAKLPPYMQPAAVFQLDDLPRNANGKVDRLATRALLERMILTKSRQPGVGENR